jgi:hypothetical protein
MTKLQKSVADYLINNCDFNPDCIDVSFVKMIIKICKIPNIDKLVENPNHVYHINNMGLLEPNEIRNILSLTK